MFSGVASLRGRAGWARYGVAVAAGALVVLAACAGAPLQAAGETGAPGGAAGAACPSSNPPNQMTLVAGTPQTAIVGTAFASALQVALSNSDGCPVTSAAAGTSVTFSAPSSGASGVFSTSASSTAVVGADASGAVAAPPFTANTAAGSYTVTASSQYGSVSFALTNTVAGVPARILALALKSRSASVMSAYPQPLQVEVLDGDGNPVAGATVTFTLNSVASSACGATTASSAGATFNGSGTEATAITSSTGVASSPLLTANSNAGSFTATAAVSGKEPSAGSGREGPGASANGAATPTTFSLSNLAGKPVKLTPGVGFTQSTPVGSAFPIGLAVTVTDAQNNPVPGSLVTFSAPAAGASGRFTVRVRDPRHGRARTSHPHTVKVKTNACGIAVAPTFTADDTRGGYIVKATVGRARPAAFALVNTGRGQS
jgi:protocatechuate 3,4-dioxygenase beta subunit